MKRLLVGLMMALWFAAGVSVSAQDEDSPVIEALRAGERQLVAPDWYASRAYEASWSDTEMANAAWISYSESAVIVIHYFDSPNGYTLQNIVRFITDLGALLDILVADYVPWQVTGGCFADNTARREITGTFNQTPYRIDFFLSQVSDTRIEAMMFIFPAANSESMKQHETLFYPHLITCPE